MRPFVIPATFLRRLRDVELTDIQDGESIIWDEATSKFVNGDATPSAVDSGPTQGLVLQLVANRHSVYAGGYNTSNVSTAAPSADTTARAYPITLDRNSTATDIYAIGFDVTTAGESGARIRAAIAENASGVPGTVLAQATITADTTGYKEVVLSVTGLEKGKTYWIVWKPENCPTTRPTMRNINTSQTNQPGLALALNGVPSGLAGGGAAFAYTGLTSTGAFSASLPEPNSTSGLIWLMGIRPAPL